MGAERSWQQSVAAAEAEGAKAEQAFVQALKKAGTDVFQDEMLDRNGHNVDLFILQHAGKAMPRPVEIQLTLQLDNVQKMQQFASATPFAAPALRLYVEGWAERTMPLAATCVAGLFARWQTSPMPDEPTFLRIGPSGKWASCPLKRRITLIERMLKDSSASRKTGEIVRVDAGMFLVKTLDQTDYRIPLRFAQEPVRYRIRQAATKGRLPAKRRVRFYPGQEDTTGTPIYLVTFDDEAA